MSRFVIADVHGNLKGMLQAFDRSGFNYKKDQLICLSDTADGYPDVKECFYTLNEVKDLIYLKSNHDFWLLDWLKTGRQPRAWTTQGGLATLNSLNFKPDKLINNLLEKAIPYYIDDKNNLFVHGGIDLSIPIEYNKDYDIIWDREMLNTAQMLHTIEENDKENNIWYKWNTENYNQYNEIFCGHTCSQTYHSDLPLHFHNVWGMDTGAGYNGFVTIMNIDTHKYWQSDSGLDLYGPNQGRK